MQNHPFLLNHYFKCKHIIDYISNVSFWTVIDMMVDPDGTLDALSNMGVTSPLADQKMSSGAQQGVSVLHPEVGAPSSALSRPEGRTTESCEP